MNQKIERKAYLIAFLSPCCGSLKRVGIYSADAIGLTVARTEEIPLDVYSISGDSFEQAHTRMIEYIRDPSSELMLGPKLRKMARDYVGLG